MVQKNNRVVEKAISRLSRSKHNRLIEGLKGLLEDAVFFILEQHEVDGRRAHLETGDTYGWAVGHNGQLVDMKITVGPNPSTSFSVEDALQGMIRHTTGYVGIIMAGMDPEKWFILDYEIAYQEITKDMIAAEFYRFFQG